MSNTLEVHAPGSKVIIGDGIEAEVLAARIMSGGYVDYTVVSWVGGSRCECTMEAFEITSDTDRMEVGFQANGKEP